MDLLISKLICALVIWVTAVFGSVLAIRFQEHDRLQHLGSLFGGGVFLGAGLLHLLADAVESLDGIYEYPVAMLFCSFGLLTTVFVESIVNLFVPKKPSDMTYSQISTTEEPREGLLFGVTERHEMNPNSQGTDGSHDHRAVLPPQRTIENQGNVKEVAIGIVLWLALCFHSFVAGFALGSSRDVWAVFAAIVAHKAVAAYALGTNLLRANISRRQYVFSLLGFSFVTPVGILLGAVAASSLDEKATGFFIAFASGTFLYVALVEILANELLGSNHEHTFVVDMSSHRPHEGHSRIDAVAYVLGWITMAALAVWV